MAAVYVHTYAKRGGERGVCVCGGRGVAGRGSDEVVSAKRAQAAGGGGGKIITWCHENDDTPMLLLPNIYLSLSPLPLINT